MENREIAIQISGLKKKYKLGQIGGGTLRGDLQSWWARVRGKEDPNSKIGTDTRSYGKIFMALNGIDLTVYKGEALGIIGHNGAGKSTLLKLLSRVTAPTEGEIGINGRISSMLEVGTGFNPQMTGRENVYMNGAILGMTKAEIDAKMEQIIEFSEVREFIDTPVKRYSSGMYVKLAFSVAAHLDSEIMIMDEVLAVGDMAFQKKCLGKMREAAKQDGRTVLYVSHNMSTIRQLCDRCVVLDQGKVVFDGDVEKAIEIYMNNAVGDIDVDVDLSKRERPNSTTGKICMKRIYYPNREDAIFKLKEPIHINLEWSSFEYLEDVRFRVSVKYIDDYVAGMAFSPVIGNAEPNVNYETKFVLDTTALVDGRYHLSISMFQGDDIRRSVSLDHVVSACSFEIVNHESMLPWEHRYHGSIILPDLKIEK